MESRLKKITEEMDYLIEILDDTNFLKSIDDDDKFYLGNKMFHYQLEYRALTGEFYKPKSI